MARVDNLSNFLTDVADAIRDKKGTSAAIAASSFDTEIAAIVTSDDVKLQEKTVSPTTSKQTVVADSNYDALSKVTVNAITLQEKTVTPNTSNQTITPDSSYNGLSKVTVNSMPTTTQATPSIAVSDAGLITASSSQSAGYVAAGTKNATKQLTTKAAETITPGTSNKTAVAKGVYTTGAVTVKGDSNLVASNIRSGKSIFGVSGTLVEGITPSGSKTITTNGTHDVTNYASAVVNVPSEDISAELTSQTNLLTTQETTIDSILTALEGKAAGGGSENLSTELNAQTTLVTSQTSKVTTAKNLINTVKIGETAIEDGLLTGAITGMYQNDRITSIGGCRLRATQITGLSCAKVTSVGSEGLRDCSQLTTINLPKCETLAGYSIGICPKLTTADFGSLKSIAAYSFYNDTLLTAVFIRSDSLCSLANVNAFTGTPIASGTGYIYVPDALLNTYKTATNWSTYANQIRTIGSYSGGSVA